MESPHASQQTDRTRISLVPVWNGDGYLVKVLECGMMEEYIFILQHTTAAVFVSCIIYLSGFIGS